jgi:gliding motility-associated-like protein
VALVSSNASCLTFQWYYNNVAIPGANTNTVNALKPGTYRVEVTTASITEENDCYLTSSIEVIDYPSPEPEIVGDLFFCDENGTTLTGSSGYASYSWNGPDIIGSVSGQAHTATLPGEYTLTVTDNNGCSGTASITVTGFIKPKISGDLSFCAGKSTQLKAPDGFKNYKWSGNGISGKDNEQICIVTKSGIYTLTVTDANDCTGTANVEVTEYLNFVPKISGDLSFCAGKSTQLKAPDGFKNYKWSGNGISGKDNEQICIVTKSGIYTLTVTDANDCTGTANVEVKEISLIPPTISGELSFCEGGSTTLVGSAGYENYEWSDDNGFIFTGKELTVTKAGTYYLIVTSEGCSKTTQVTVTVVPYPNIMQVITSGVNRRAEVMVTPPGNYQYSLNMFTWQSSNVFTNLDIGVHNVWVKADPGCITGPFNFKIIEIPNVITPDGDNLNDSWRLRNLKGGTHVQIYDRYGKLLFDKTATGISEDIEWDGKYLGRAVSSTSYWYTITLPEGERLTGWLMVRNYHSR